MLFNFSNILSLLFPGSIRDRSVDVVISDIRVTYRLTYDEVDEMLEDGTAYFEEVEMGALLELAKLRRAFRINNGSTEGLVPFPVPKGMLHVKRKNGNLVGSDINDINNNELDVTVVVEQTHSGGRNVTAVSGVEYSPTSSVYDSAPPASGANLLVTEMMILAGEAMGRYGIDSNNRNNMLNINDISSSKRNTYTASELTKTGKNKRRKLEVLPLLDETIDLPYRAQSSKTGGDFRSSSRTKSGKVGVVGKTKDKTESTKRNYHRPIDSTYLDALSERGHHYSQAWAARRLFGAATISSRPLPHFGMGLDCYVRWTSPIRRFGDIQVHSVVKRSLRRSAINNLMRIGERLPEGITSAKLGCPVPRCINVVDDDAETKMRYVVGEYDEETAKREMWDVDHKWGAGYERAVFQAQESSRSYWFCEYVRTREKEEKRSIDDEDVQDNTENEAENGGGSVVYDAIVLGCTDQRRNKYVVYLPELGLEWSYLSGTTGELQVGQNLRLVVENINPVSGIMTFNLANRL